MTDKTNKGNQPPVMTPKQNETGFSKDVTDKVKENQPKQADVSRAPYGSNQLTEPKTNVEVVKSAEDEARIVVRNFAKVVTTTDCNVKCSSALNEMFNLVRKTLMVKSQADFNRQWSAILNAVHEQTKQGLAAHNILKGTPLIESTEEEFVAYSSIMNVILRTANPETRYKSKRVISGDTLVGYVSEIGQNAVEKLSGYYSF